jgi:hypothetical protein
LQPAQQQPVPVPAQRQQVLQQQVLQQQAQQQQALVPAKRQQTLVPALVQHQKLQQLQSLFQQARCRLLRHESPSEFQK